MRGIGRWAAIGEIVVAAMLAFLVAPSVGAFVWTALGWVWPHLQDVSSVWRELVAPLAAQQMALAALGWVGLRRMHRRRSSAWPLLTKGALWGFLLFVTNGIAAAASIVTAQALLGQERVANLLQMEANPLESLFAPHSPLLLVGAGLVLVSVTAPVAEELFFRGFVYGSLQESFGTRAALWGSALVFAAPHMYLVQFVSIFLIGILLAIAYRREGSLVVPIIAHAVMNGFVAFTALLA